MNPCRKTISPSCTYTKNNVRAIRFGNALRISQRADPFCEPGGGEQGARHGESVRTADRERKTRGVLVISLSVICFITKEQGARSGERHTRGQRTDNRY